MNDTSQDTSKYIVTDATVVIDDDDDLDANPITLPDGTVLDNEAAERYGQEIADRVAAKRGRPSLTGSAAHSPSISARVTPELRDDLDAIAAARGVPTSAVLREALTEYAAAHRPSA